MGTVFHLGPGEHLVLTSAFIRFQFLSSLTRKVAVGIIGIRSIVIRFISPVIIPASTTTSSPSRNGKNASLATTVPCNDKPACCAI